MKKLILFSAVILISFVAFAQQKISAEFPKATIAGKSGGDITKDEIIKAGVLKMSNADFKIEEFSFSFPGTANVTTLKSTSDKLTPEMLAAIQRMTRGQYFKVEKIKAVKTDGTVNWLDAQNYSIQ